jgi:hypothetical protein
VTDTSVPARTQCRSVHGRKTPGARGPASPKIRYARGFQRVAQQPLRTPREPHEPFRNRWATTTGAVSVDVTVASCALTAPTQQ